MKITRRQLRKLIREASSLQMAQYDNRSDDIMIVTSLILSGIDGGLALMPGRPQLTDEESYEYGQDIRVIVENQLPVRSAKALADIWREVKTGGGFEDPVGDVMTPEPTPEEEAEEEDAYASGRPWEHN
jgi:hypothetical protein